MKYEVDIKNTWDINKELTIFQRSIFSTEKTFKRNNKQVNKSFVKIDPKLGEKKKSIKIFF